MELKTVTMYDGQNPQQTIIVNESVTDKFKKLGFSLKPAKQAGTEDTGKDKASNDAGKTPDSTDTGKDDKGKNKQTGAV